MNSTDTLSLINFFAAMLSSIFFGLGAIIMAIDSGLGLWPTSRLMFPADKLAPALRIFSLLPASEQPTVPIVYGERSHLWLAQAGIYLACTIWANVLAAMILSSQPCKGLLLSAVGWERGAGVTIGLFLTAATSMVAFYKLQTFFYQKIASGKLGRNDYINQLRFNCCIFAGFLFLALPLTQSVGIAFHILTMKIEPIAFLKIGWGLSIVPLALVQLVIVLHSNPFRQGNYLDLFRFRRALKGLQRENCSLTDSLKTRSDADLVGFAEIVKSDDDLETLAIIENILNERYEKQH